jgi:hypothetical protein
VREYSFGSYELKKNFIAAPVCSSSGRGMLLSLNLSATFPWTRYSHNLTTLTARPVLVFGFETENGRDFFLDDVSIVDVSAPNIELLQNPSFENSTTTLNGWSLWCSISCGGTGANITSGSNCHNSSGKCFQDNCSGSGISFLGQSFWAVINQVYTITYWLRGAGGGGGNGNQNHFYIDIG